MSQSIHVGGFSVLQATDLVIHGLHAQHAHQPLIIKFFFFCEY